MNIEFFSFVSEKIKEKSNLEKSKHYNLFQLMH